MADRPAGHLAELALRSAARPVVVIDDDPTGTQTLRDVAVLTAWDSDAVARHLPDGVVFLSTNSRAHDGAAAVAITHDAAVTAVGAARLARRPISIVSRSDSTLRGHYPAETRAVAEAIGAPGEARVLLAPYFGEAGRVTVDDVHLLERGGARQPVAETEFARDEVFGYRSSNLRDWVAEKHATAGGPLPPLASLSLDLIRTGGPDAVTRSLLALPPSGVAVANAEIDGDIEAVALGALMAEEEGLPLVARTAASYVRARAGRPAAPPLTADELETDGPGLIVVGSHVTTTTQQLEHLTDALGDGQAVTHEVAVGTILAGGAPATDAVAVAAAALNSALAGGRIAIATTERTRRDVGVDGARALSAALVEIVRRVERRPGWVIAKGGITSFDVAKGGLELREARVRGQILPGVPVWIGSGDSRWPGVPLVVFPGNVGGTTALLDAVRLLVT